MDPWGGQKDLKTRTLRAVGDAHTRFREDSLRILRGVRFSVTYQLTPEADTAAAMEELAPLMDTLARERVFVELSKLLPKITAEQLMRYAPVLSQAIPELAPMIGFDQCSPHHAYDVFTHTAYTVEKVGPQLPVRLAALLHDIGKPATFTKDENGRGHFYDHAKVGATIAEQVLQQLKVPTELREQVVFLVEHHMTALEPDKKILRRRIGKYGFAAVLTLLELQKADCASKGVPEETVSFRAVEQLLEQIQQEDACFSVKDLAIKGEDLIAMGFPAGPQMGKCLEFLLGQIQDEKILNTREALLAAAKNYMEGLQ
jgi:tRNA nucleotidyltransferase (CCA-adding enzyme)